MNDSIHLSRGSVAVRLDRRLPRILLVALALATTVVVHSSEAQAKRSPMCLGKRATIVGSNKANTLRGTKKADVIVGLGGNDRIIGGGGGDRICGGAGADRLFGGLGNDQLNGGWGVDECLQEVGTGAKKKCEGPKFPLTVSKAGTGTGTVTSSPSVIECGASCVGAFFEGQKVTLTAAASSSHTFDGWAGPCTGTDSCVVVMVKATAVTAMFSAGSSPGTPGGPGGSPPPVVTCAAPCFVVSKTGSTYKSVSPSKGTTYTGNLKFVVESAVRDLNGSGGGDIVFTAGLFDLGTDPLQNRFSLHDISDIKFLGQGMDATVIQNYSTDPKDSEPFDMHGANRIVIRDMTVNAGGTDESTSDAIDFDGGNDVLIERVKIADSRGRGIVFDGKDAPGGVPRHANRNVVRDCVVLGVPRHGIELLASNNNRIEGCTISSVVEDGILINMATSNAGQPNKHSNDNVLVGNTIEAAGEEGIEIFSSDRNTVEGNTIKNPGRDGVRLTAPNQVTGLEPYSCDDNRVRNTTVTDNQRTRVQYGLNIQKPLCKRTVVGPNNKVDPINDKGTSTQYV
jgi:parallel beta-helix repeat protein